jgi:hypothetical protein
MTQRARLNQASTVGLIGFSLTAFAVALPLWYGMATGRVPPPNGDEGVAAHIFQLSRPGIGQGDEAVVRRATSYTISSSSAWDHE